MVGSGGNQALLTAWRAIQTAIYPEGDCDAETRRALEDEASEGNARLLSWGGYVAALMNALPVMMVLRQMEPGPSGAVWAFWLVVFSAVTVALMILAAIVARLRRPAAMWRVVGDLVGVLALLGTAARSANAQRLHPNINLFVAAAFFTAFFLRMRPRVYALALVAGAALVLGGIAHFRQDAARPIDQISLIGTSAFALLGFFIARAMHVRELLARRRAARLNAELERRVEVQVRDLTERRRGEEALREAMVAADAANRAKSAFLANMSHEIRTPMNAVLGYTQLLQQGAGLAPEQRQHLEVIRRNGDRLLALINDVLEMSKIEAGHREIQRGSVDVRKLIDEIERMFRHRAEEKRLTFEIEEEPDVPAHILGDERRLRQVLVNLVDNAVKFTVRGSVLVQVGTRSDAAGQARLLVAVEDTGPGIPSGDLSGLFRPFAQLRAGIYAQGGTGLGLALSRELARLMDGDITVESRLDVGSVFRLEIPFALADAAPVEAAAPGEPSEPEPLSSLPGPAVVLLQHAAALPAALVAEISGALGTADYDALIALSARFPPERLAAGEALRALVEQYRYDDITAALAGPAAPLTA
jgi:signal transduction histidine kinase